MKTQRELEQKYWNDIHDMVEEYNKTHSANVKPWECVKWNGTVMTPYPTPGFDDSPDSYQFAVAILYDEQAGVHRPVFPGDTVYEKSLLLGLTVVDANTLERNVFKFKDWDWSKFSWHKPKPKRTFEINGVELPCPVENEDSFVVHISGRPYYFKSLDEAVTVGKAINKILTEARDKP